MRTSIYRCHHMRESWCLSSETIPGVFFGDSMHLTLVAAPVLPRDTSLNSPVCLSVRLSVCLSFIYCALGCSEQDVKLLQAISSNPVGPMRKPDIHDPGSSGSSCDETFTLSFVFSPFLCYCFIAPRCRCLLLELTSYKLLHVTKQL